MANQVIIDKLVAMFDYAYNDIINEHILKKIFQCEKIIFQNKFNQSIDSLNIKITHLKLGYAFNKSYTKFNKFFNMTHLYLNCYVIDIINEFPSNLKWLKLTGYDHSINNLPVNLIYLIIDCIYHHKIDNLPCGLLYLSIYELKETTYYLPSSLKYIKLYHTDYQVFANLPNNIQSIKFINNIQYLNLLTCKFKYLKIFFNKNNTNIILPNNLTHFIIYNDIKCNDVNLNILPQNLKYLDSSGVHLDFLSLPNSIEIIKFTPTNKILDMIFPINLKIITLYRNILHKYHGDILNNISIAKLRPNIKISVDFTNNICYSSHYVNLYSINFNFWIEYDYDKKFYL